LEKAHKIEMILKKENAALVNQRAKFPGTKTDTGLLTSFQNFLKTHGRIYYFLLNVFEPVWPSTAYRRTIKKLLRKYDREHIVLNMGSGPTYFNERRDLINVDFHPYEEVDIVADITDLPVADGTIDFIINIAVLEHVEQVHMAVREMFRILKPGGEVLCYVPFIVPFHGAPQDFHRWTMLGMEKLFANYEILETGIGCGPTSGLLWIFQEWTAILFSFGSKKLHDVILLFLLIVLMPLKVIDIILARFPHAEKIASGFYIVASKKEGPICLASGNRFEDHSSS